jgi:hypothetical protein
MDVGNKTLSQLSSEAREKRYVTLDVGAKVSGYTKDYLERLCRLNKVEYRLWNNGQFVIEIDSLLRETHTILLSYEDVTFVEKSEIVDSVEQSVAEVLLSVAQADVLPRSASEANSEASRIFSQKNIEGITQSMPSFGAANRAGGRDVDVEAFSFVGHAVVSDPLHRDTQEEKNIHIPISVDAAGLEKSAPTQMNPVIAISEVPRHASHVAISYDNEPAHPDPTLSQPKTSGPVHLNVLRDVPNSPPVASAIGSGRGDDWDSAILLTPDALRIPAISIPESRALPSGVSVALHPIQTSIDAREHHDDMPLFPIIEKKASPALVQAIPAIAPVSHFPGIPDLGSEKRFIVFSPTELVKKNNVNEFSPTPKAPTPAHVADDAVHPSVAVLFPASAFPVVSLGTPVLASSPNRNIERVIPIVPEKTKNILPVSREEHHLALRKDFPLVKSTLFNVAFVSCLLLAFASLQLDFSRVMFDKSITYVAAVAGAREADSTSRNDAQTTAASVGIDDTASTLPFSDDVRVATGTTPNSVAVSPVFDGNQGDAIEYIISRGGQYVENSEGE